MKIRNVLAIPVLCAAIVIPAYADHVTADYNHSTNFTRIRTYSWAEVHTTNSIWDSRVKAAIDQQLSEKGWVQVPSGGDVALVAVEKVAVHRQYDTTYDGFGGSRWGGIGDSTLFVDDYKVGTLVVSLFDDHSRNLIWRGTSSRDLAGNPEANTKKLDADVQKMFRKFPPQSAAE
jgi:hypothetical protein